MPPKSKHVEPKEFTCIRCKQTKPASPNCALGLNNAGDIYYECFDCRDVVRRSILLYVQLARWRVETTIIRYICDLEQTWTVSRVIDELFRLVSIGELSWFGAEEAKVGPNRALSDPLKYRYVKGLLTDNAINLAS